MDKTTIGLKTVFERLMFYCCMAMLIVGPLVGELAQLASIRKRFMWSPTAERSPSPTPKRLRS